MTVFVRPDQGPPQQLVVQKILLPFLREQPHHLDLREYAIRMSHRPEERWLRSVLRLGLSIWQEFHPIVLQERYFCF